MDTSNTKKAAALSFLKSNNTGVLSTLSPDGTPRSRMVYYVCGEDFSIYFLTLISTRKVEDIKHRAEVAFSVSNENVPQAVEIEGIAKDVSDIPVSDETVQSVFRQLQSNTTYQAPLTHFDAAVVKLFRITPTWIRWGDFTSGKHTSDVLSELIAEDS
ncbi:MAG: hypothetical protein AB203_02675 [Parcubacteria bacterium C7867-008]|nr:MAG: hypothetical protein AB203_02675 [Parcubacteria bacterium C7867-008]